MELDILPQDIMYKSKLESFDEFQAKKTSTLRSELAGSYGIVDDAARVVELDFPYSDEDSEDEGYVRVLSYSPLLLTISPFFLFNL